MARLNWVPLHSIIVVRDGKQVDAYEASAKGTKSFKFTADEIKDIPEIGSLREPVDEDAVTGDEIDDAKLPETPAIIVPKPLAGLDRTALLALAKEEGVTFQGQPGADKLVELIEAKRNAL